MLKSSKEKDYLQRNDSCTESRQLHGGEKRVDQCSKCKAKITVNLEFDIQLNYHSRMKKKELHVWATKDLLRIDSCRGTKKCIAERENSPPEGKLGIQERM